MSTLLQKEGEPQVQSSCSDKSRQDRIPTLDGWRGIAILLVIVDHFQPYRNGGPSSAWTDWIGQHGVTIFFVLSGYLVTSRLLEELHTSGTISLQRFYLRRSFRLFPAAWLYLGLLLLVGEGKLISRGDFVSCIFFFRNFYNPHGVSLTLNFWTLSIEEQFYLVWPSLLVFCERRKVISAAFAGVGVVAVYRLTHWQSTMGLPMFYSSGTQLHADSLLVGSLTALLKRKPFFALIVNRIPIWPSFITLILCFRFFHHFIPLGETILIALLIYATSSSRTSYLSRILEWKPLAQIGVLSYSIYIWQEPVSFFFPHQTRLLWLKLAAVAITAFASFYCLETPCRNLGRRVERICRNLPTLERAEPV